MTDKDPGKKSNMGRNLEIDDSLLPGASVPIKEAPTEKAPKSRQSVSFRTPVRMPPPPPQKETKKAAPVTPRPERMGPQERPTVQMEAADLQSSVFEANLEPQESGDSWFKYAAFFAFGFLVATIIALSTSPTVPNVPILDAPVKPDSTPLVADSDDDPPGEESKATQKKGPPPPVKKLVQLASKKTISVQDSVVSTKTVPSPNALKEPLSAKDKKTVEKPAGAAVQPEKKVEAVPVVSEKKVAAPPVDDSEKKATTPVAAPAPENKAIDVVLVRNPSTRKVVLEKKPAPKRVVMPFMVTARVPLKLRKGPKQDTKRVGGVPAGTEIFAMGRKPRSAFIKVRYGKKIGWVAYIRGFVIFPEGRTIGDLPVVKE